MLPGANNNSPQPWQAAAELMPLDSNPTPLAASLPSSERAWHPLRKAGVQGLFIGAFQFARGDVEL